MAELAELKSQDYLTGHHPIWCPGCGDFGVLSSMTKAFAQLKLRPEEIVLVSGIGCSGRTPGFVNSYGFHTVHGRILPVATGVKVANPSLTVLGVGGDGDAYAIGGGHIPHAARRNVDMLYLVMDNEIYGLTKGQFSPTSQLQLDTGTTPYGNLEEPMNPIGMAIAYGVSFVARAYSGKPNELTQLIVRAIEHKGFALINVISPCITFNNIYKTIPALLADIPADHNVTDRSAAFKLAQDPTKLYVGVFYETTRPTFEEKIALLTKRAMESGAPKLEEILTKFD